MPLTPDGPDEELLARETDRVVRDAQPALEGRLFFSLPTARARRGQDGRPELTVALFPDCMRDRALCEAQVPSVLRACASLIAHARRLGAHAALHAAFWRLVCQSPMTPFTEPGLRAEMFLEASSPAICLNVGSNGTLGRVTSGLVEHLHAFLTTPLPGATVTGSKTPPPPTTLGLSFARCKLTTEALERVQQLLARVSVDHPDCLVAVDRLDLSQNDMDAAELAVVAAIAERSAAVYGIETLVLDDIGHAAPVRSLLQTVLGIASGPSGSVRVSQSAPRTTLKSLSLSDTRIQHQDIAALCSALRYGSRVTDLSLLFQLRDSRHVRVETTRAYWRWLAFALFYPRPKRFEQTCRLRGVGHIALDTRDAVHAVARTLRDPLAALLGSSEVDASQDSRSNRSGRTRHRDLMVCSLRCGATITLDTSSLSLASPQQQQETLEVCDTFTELEALTVRPDGSVCVVVPGVGLGWILPADVERIEREPLTSAHWAAHRGKYDLELALPAATAANEASLQTVIAVVGPQLRSLAITRDSKSVYVDGTLQQLLGAASESLETLALSFPEASRNRTLLTALAGPLGSHLRALELRITHFSATFTAAFMQPLAQLVARRERVLALEELDLDGRLDPVALPMLFDALQVNRTLRVLKIAPMRRALADAADMCTRLDDAFQNQVLFSLPRKLAFASVLALRDVTGDIGAASQESAQRAAAPAAHIDQWVLAHIFAFAGSRRMIVWADAQIDTSS